jgi:2-polyprenyl-3-methyl-5-hydroxy-6-metoxy-1,4-benzoquinol methylase
VNSGDHHLSVTPHPEIASRSTDRRSGCRCVPTTETGMALDRAKRNGIARHYAHRGHRWHARWKLACDPAYAAVADLLGNRSLPLLDIGCGIGLLGQYLHAEHPGTRYIGVDHDPRKIAAACEAAAGLDGDMDFRCADAATLPPVHGHVVMLDVLHYLSAARQQALLRVALAHLAPEGTLVIRNVLREPNWRFHATRVEEFFLRVSGWIPGGAQHYPDAEELGTPLRQAGLDVQVSPLRGRTPYNSYLLVARFSRVRTKTDVSGRDRLYSAAQSP